jgi:hypothetical protein
LGLFALDVNAEPSAPLWRPRRNGERHQGEQRPARTALGHYAEPRRLSHSRDVATYIIASNARRHVSKGQQAMAVAMMHPEPAKTKRKGSPDDAAPAELAVAATKDTFGNPPFAGALTQPATLSRRLRRSRRHRRPRPLPSRIRGVSIVETACGLD